MFSYIRSFVQGRIHPKCFQMIHFKWSNLTFTCIMSSDQGKIRHVESTNATKCPRVIMVQSRIHGPISLLMCTDEPSTPTAITFTKFR
ncbi:unnamed protein product [Caenorhabditis nigoni]